MIYDLQIFQAQREVVDAEWSMSRRMITLGR